MMTKPIRELEYKSDRFTISSDEGYQVIITFAIKNGMTAYIDHENEDHNAWYDRDKISLKNELTELIQFNLGLELKYYSIEYDEFIGTRYDKDRLFALLLNFDSDITQFSIAPIVPEITRILQKRLKLVSFAQFAQP